jgi:hypothetical protein
MLSKNPGHNGGCPEVWRSVLLASSQVESLAGHHSDGVGAPSESDRELTVEGRVEIL